MVAGIPLLFPKRRNPSVLRREVRGDLQHLKLLKLGAVLEQERENRLKIANNLLRQLF